MNLQRVKVVNQNNGWLGTEYYIDENRVNNVRSVDFRVAVNEAPTFTFATMGLPDMDILSDVQFRFTPETVQHSAVVLQNEFKQNTRSMDALIASIESAIKESPKETWHHDLAVLIAHRIVGMGDN